MPTANPLISVSKCAPFNCHGAPGHHGFNQAMDNGTVLVKFDFRHQKVPFLEDRLYRSPLAIE